MCKKILVLVLLCFVAILTPTTSHAFEWLDNTVATLEDNLDEGSIAGLGVLYSTSPYKGIDDNVFPVPIIRASYKGFFINQTLAGYNFIDDESLKLGIVVGPHFGGYDASESNDLTGMQDRDWGIDGGLRLTLKNEIVDVSATVLTDLSDTSTGQEVSLGLSKKLFEGFLTPKIGATWSSENVVDYYYGVKASEATAGRAAYSPNSTVNYNVGLTVAYPLGDKWAIISDVQYQIFGDEIKDSPIIDKNGNFRLVLGTVYRF